jgi:hypothetical protein
MKNKYYSITNFCFVRLDSGKFQIEGTGDCLMCNEPGPQVNNRHNILKVTKKFLKTNLHAADS